MRDVPWEDIFPAATSEFCEWVHVGIDLFILHIKYQIKLHLSSWFSAAWAAAIVHRNHLFRLYQTDKPSDFKVKFRQVGLLDQLDIFSQLFLIELVGILTGLGVLKLWHLIYPRLLTGFNMLVFFTNLSFMEFQTGYLALFLLFSVIEGFKWFCMESQVWAGTSSCYVELFDKLQYRICRTLSPSLAPSLEPLPHRQNVASLSLFYRHHFGRCSSDFAQLVPLPFPRGKSDRLRYFSRC